MMCDYKLRVKRYDNNDITNDEIIKMLKTDLKSSLREFVSNESISFIDIYNHISYIDIEVDKSTNNDIEVFINFTYSMDEDMDEDELIQILKRNIFGVVDRTMEIYKDEYEIKYEIE